MGQRCDHQWKILRLRYRRSLRNPAGLYFSTSIQDNGTAASDPVDQISFSYISDAPFDCSTQEDVPLFEAPEGQVTVR